MTHYKTKQEAREAGFISLTTAYGPTQRWMMQKVLDDMRAANIPCVLVDVPEGTEVWRSLDGYRSDSTRRAQQ